MFGAKHDIKYRLQRCGRIFKINTFCLLEYVTQTNDGYENSEVLVLLSECDSEQSEDYELDSDLPESKTIIFASAHWASKLRSTHAVLYCFGTDTGRCNCKRPGEKICALKNGVYISCIIIIIIFVYVFCVSL